MRIISKFKDYYDSCMKYGMDDTLVYLRNREEISVDSMNKVPPIWSRSRLLSNVSFKQHEIFTYGHIGFCGRLHIYVCCEKLNKKTNKFSRNYFYDFESFKRSFTDLKDNKKYSSVLKGAKGVFLRNPVSNRENLFISYNVPCFTIDDIDGRNFFVKNPRLADYQFFKVFDSFSAYQEIFMFLGNQLCNTKEAEVPVGSDIVLSESKGYDKWSFRKEPEKN